MFTKGDKVYWTDPEGLTSGWYEVRWDQADYDPQGPDEYMGELPDDIVALVNDEGTEVEAMRHELSMKQVRTIEIFPDLLSKIVFSVQTERSELLRKELDEVDGSGTVEETALGLAINLIEDRLKHSKEIKRLKEKVVHLLLQEREVERILNRRIDICPGCGDELLIFDEDCDIEGCVVAFCEGCEFETRVEV
jgi:hypothetical protein